jgi:hypothetical protein
MAAKTIDAAWIKTRVGDELGLTDDDLVRLYGIDAKALNGHLATLGNDSQSAYEQILSDVDAVRVGYRQVQVDDGHIAAIRKLLNAYPFHPLVSIPMADGQIGWRLGGDDAQYVAFRTADAVGIDFEWGEVLRTRLNRAIIWPDTAMPQFNKAFRDRVADITFYLVELSGVL